MSLLRSESLLNVDADKIRVRLAEEIAIKWNESNIQYVVVNGLFEYPSKLGRDLDVVVNRREVQKALSIIQEIGKIHGFLHFVRWSHFGLYQSVLIKVVGNELISLPIDLLCTDYVWRVKFINLTSSNEILNSPISYKGPFKESEYGKYLKNIIRPFLCGDIKRFQTKYKVPIKISEALVSHKLVLLFGNKGARIIKRMLGSQYDYIAKNINSTKLKLQIHYFLKHPFKFVNSAYQMLFTRFMLLIINRPVYLAILAKDSSIYDYLEPLRQWLLKGFLAVDIKKITPNFFYKKIKQYDYLKIKFYHLWRNWITDNRSPISEIRMIIRLYTTSLEISNLIKDIEKIKKMLGTNAVAIFENDRIIVSFFTNEINELSFSERYTARTDKEKIVYVIGSTIIKYLPSLIR